MSPNGVQHRLRGLPIGRALLIAAAALFSGFTTCGSDRGGGPSTSTVIGKDQSCPTGDVAALDPGSLSGPDAGLAAFQPSAARAAGPRPPKPSFTSGLLVPPETPGEVRSDFSGCLALTEMTAAAGARFPAPALTEGPPPAEPVRVGPMGKGLVVSHDLAHPCCLQGEVSAALAGSELVITERLAGTACDCRCTSTVRSAVGAAPGEYTVVVKVQEGAGEREVFRGPVTVPPGS